MPKKTEEETTLEGVNLDIEVNETDLGSFDSVQFNKQNPITGFTVTSGVFKNIREYENSEEIDLSYTAPKTTRIETVRFRL